MFELTPISYEEIPKYSNIPQDLKHQKVSYKTKTTINNKADFNVRQ